MKSSSGLFYATAALFYFLTFFCYSFLFLFLFQLWQPNSSWISEGLPFFLYLGQPDMSHFNTMQCTDNTLLTKKNMQSCKSNNCVFYSCLVVHRSCTSLDMSLYASICVYVRERKKIEKKLKYDQHRFSRCKHLGLKMQFLQAFLFFCILFYSNLVLLLWKVPMGCIGLVEPLKKPRLFSSSSLCSSLYSSARALWKQIAQKQIGLLKDVYMHTHLGIWRENGTTQGKKKERKKKRNVAFLHSALLWFAIQIMHQGIYAVETKIHSKDISDNPFLRSLFFFFGGLKASRLITSLFFLFWFLLWTWNNYMLVVMRSATAYYYCCYCHHW